MEDGTIRQNQMAEWWLVPRICEHCNKEYLPEHPDQKYHDEKCKRAAENKRYYERHRDKVIKGVMARNQKQQRNKANKPVVERQHQFDDDVRLIQETLKFSTPKGAIRYAVRKLAKSIRQKDKAT